MMILFDECVPWPLHKLLVGHTCVSTQQRGWGGLKNGELLDVAEKGFDVFLTADQNLRYQQNLSNRHIAILQLSTNRLGPVLLSASAIVSVLETLRPGEFRSLNIG